LHPNKEQEATLKEWFQFCCLLYNSALQERRDAYKKFKKNISYYDQCRSLTEIRKDKDYADTPSWTSQRVLAKLEEAFKAFFRRVKSGEAPGYPRFKSSKRWDSFDFLPKPNILYRKNRIHITSLGLVKANIYRPLQGIPKRATVKVDPTGKWWVSIACDLGNAPPKVPIFKSTGMDLGLTHFSTLADGTRILNPRFFRQSEEILVKCQRRLETKKHGSNNRNRARVLVAKIHKKIQNQRLDFFRKLAVCLFENYDMVAYEDLKGMTSGRLAKSVHDASWRTFTGVLACKAESAGKHAIPVNPRNTSQKCSGCQGMPSVKKDLSVRTHSCPVCRLILDRDHNAAINILELGLSSFPGSPEEKSR
jgi:putative transposase